MASHSKKKRDLSNPGNFSQLEAAIATIQMPFLRNSINAYSESAALLMQGLSRIAGQSQPVPQALKHARLLDMILAVGEASNYLSTNDQTVAHKTRQSIENKLAACTQQQANGIITINGLTEPLKVKTYSAVGRCVAKLFGGIPVQTDQGRSAKGVIQNQTVSETAKELLDEGKFDEAIQKYEEALRVKPGEVNSLLGLGMAHMMKGDDKEALDRFNQALGLAPNSADVLAQVGCYHHIRNETEKASIYYAKALKIAPSHLLALYRYGALLCLQRKTEQGLGLINKALRIQPENIDFLCTKAYNLLATGNYVEGWALYEHGLKAPEWRKTDLFPNKRIWNGEPIPEKKLLLLSEQGLGDALQFVRYADQCKKMAKKTYVLCRPSLARLLRNCPYIDKVFTGIGRWQFDEQISMMSLPHILGTTLDTIPSHVPYLFVPKNITDKFYRKLGFSAHTKKLKVGLVWSGSMFSNTLRGDLRAKRRNIELKKLLPLFDLENIIFCNLQMGEASSEIDTLGLRNRFVDGMSAVKDMLDTAAIVENLDLVITVDTSVAHLAGGLGKPVWIMSRYDADWRWLMNRQDSPWYPMARIFGQPSSGDWESVVKNIYEALKEMCCKMIVQQIEMR